MLDVCIGFEHTADRLADPVLEMRHLEASGQDRCQNACTDQKH